MSPPCRLPRQITLLPRPQPTLPPHLWLLPLPPLLISSTRGRPSAPLPSLVPVPLASVLEPSRPAATAGPAAMATGATATAGGTAAMATATGATDMATDE